MLQGRVWISVNISTSILHSIPFVTREFQFCGSRILYAVYDRDVLQKILVILSCEQPASSATLFVRVWQENLPEKTSVFYPLLTEYWSESCRSLFFSTSYSTFYSRCSTKGKSTNDFTWFRVITIPFSSCYFFLLKKKCHMCIYVCPLFLWSLEISYQVI